MVLHNWLRSVFFKGNSSFIVSWFRAAVDFTKTPGFWASKAHNRTKQTWRPFKPAVNAARMYPACLMQSQMLHNAVSLWLTKK